MLELFGAAEATALVACTARLIGLQFYAETADLLDVAGSGADDFARFLATIAAAQGEEVEIVQDGKAAVMVQKGWKLMAGIAASEDMFDAWNALWQGAASVHNRDLTLTTERRDGTIYWRLS